eukprot:1152642-Rhodomonas_salina.2
MSRAPATPDPLKPITTWDLFWRAIKDIAAKNSAPARTPKRDHHAPDLKMVAGSAAPCRRNSSSLSANVVLPRSRFSGRPSSSPFRAGFGSSFAERYSPIPAVPADPASLSPTSVFQARQTCAKIILAQAGSSTADDQTLIVFSNRDIGCGCRSKAMVVNMSSNHDDPTTPKPVLMAETEKHAARIQTPELVAAPLEQAAPPFSILPRVDPVGETFNQSTGGIDYPICAKGQAPMRRDPANPSQVLISYLRPSRPQAAVAAQPQGCSSAIALPYYQVFVDPPVLQVPNLISAEAAVYLKNMPNGDWKASMVGHGVFSHSKDTSTRTLEMEKSANRQSLSHSLERGIRTRDPVVLNIEMRIAQLLAAADPSHGDMVDWLS